MIGWGCLMKIEKPPHHPESRSVWVRPRLERIGNLEKIVHAGGGKLSQVGDPGDARKPSGLG
jgi:hypothetical protein